MLQLKLRHLFWLLQHPSSFKFPIFMGQVLIMEGKQGLKEELQVGRQEVTRFQLVLVLLIVVMVEQQGRLERLEQLRLEELMA